MKKILTVSILFCTIFITTSSFGAQGFRTDPMCSEAPCFSVTPAILGGPVAKNSDLLTLRWLGEANMEITYKGQVILLSAYFEANPREDQVINPADITRVDALFLGHAHGDHMSDAARVARQTGAKVYAPKYAYEKLAVTGVPAQGIDPLPAGQVHYVNNGEKYRFKGLTVEAIHIFHSGINGDPPAPQGPTQAQSTAYRAWVDSAWGGPLTPEEQAKKDAIMARGSMDPGIRTEGVMAYLFTFGKDFRLIYYDSAATKIAPEIEEVMQRIGGVDVAMVAHAGGHSHTQVPYTMVPIRLFNPRLFIPEHHGGYEMSIEKLFHAIRAELPKTNAVSLLYKEPICFNVKSHTATKVSPLGDVWYYNMNK